MTESQDMQPSDDAAELSPGTEVGGYVVEAKIGEGGMGVVYGAHHPRIGKRVAIKVLSPAFCGDPATVERFEQEARLVNEIRHPNIVDVFQFGELADGRSFFVMEWLEGESLSARLEKGPMPPREAIDVLDAMCDALEAAHEKGVIHRDLKSDNVFIVPVRKEKRVKLLDFGLAKLDTGRNDPDSIHKTKDGIVVGTPAYMSPEQARGKKVDHRTDIYALGCLAYKMVTGTLPFNADNAMDLIVKQLNDAPPSPTKLAPRTPAPLSRVIQRMMSKAPEDRPTLAEIRKVLAELRAPTAAAPAKKPRALSVLIGFLLFLCGVITLGVIGLIKQRDDGPAPAAAPPATPAGSASAAGSAEPAPPTPDQPSVIEFEDDKVGNTRTPKPTPSATPSTASTATANMPAATTTPRTGATAAGTKTDADGDAVTPPDDLAVKPRPGRILVMLQRSSQIELDGRTMSTDSKGGTFEVLAGSHTLRITAAGRPPITRTVDVEAGGTAVMRIDDASSPASTAPSPTPTPDKPADKPVDKPADPSKKSDDGVFDPSTGGVVPQD